MATVSSGRTMPPGDQRSKLRTLPEVPTMAGGGGSCRVERGTETVVKCSGTCSCERGAARKT